LSQFSRQAGEIMRKRDRQRFVHRCHELIKTFGGVRTEGFYEWALPTRYGRLGLTVTENTAGGPGTVFTRFDDPQAAHPHTGCNRFSGKWNHHYFDNWTVDTALADLECDLHRVLPAETCEAHDPEHRQ
jgi:hypothetical protein